LFRLTTIQPECNTYRSNASNVAEAVLHSLTKYLLWRLTIRTHLLISRIVFGHVQCLTFSRFCSRHINAAAETPAYSASPTSPPVAPFPPTRPSPGVSGM